MKKYLVFIIILLNSFNRIDACGFGPSGEEVRYSLFLPTYFDYDEFRPFYYNASLLGFESSPTDPYEANVLDWFNFSGQQVPIEAIYECLNTLNFSEIHPYSQNQFLQYLYKNNFTNVIQYLISAKQCEVLNSFDQNDPWERKDTLYYKIDHFLSHLNQLLNQEESFYLKRKYAFIAIRTAYYHDKPLIVKSLYQRYFMNGDKDYLYYWALFFYTFQQKYKEVSIANIFENSPEKRYAIYYYFHGMFNLNSGLKLAKSNREIANLYAFASVQKLGPSLEYLKKIYAKSSRTRLLDFLLLREINKIEDWIYTPYYNNYLPSIVYNGYAYSDNSMDKFTTDVLRSRSEKDRRYANEILNFVEKVDLHKILNVALWKAAQIQLLFMTRKYERCLSEKKSSRRNIQMQRF